MLTILPALELLWLREAVVHLVLSLIGIIGDEIAPAFGIVIGVPLMVVLMVHFSVLRCAVSSWHLVNISFSSSDKSFVYTLVLGGNMR
jgi:hypothetical protein